ncbi:otoancorin [Kryptolebias marmoratus]|uniref:otoancorin n=1 Tax=Kryptolebias marmoratus TaxID=37003 RepID=UPI0018ACC6DB|nr:otoancorin [Kryptolebias marmoratus]
MSPKGGTSVFLLTVACAVLATVCTAEPPDVMSANDASFIAKKLMMNCRDKGYPAPATTLLNSVFNNSNLPAEAATTDQSSTIQSSFLQFLGSVAEGKYKNPLRQLSMNVFEKMKSNTWNCSYLATMIKTMSSSSDPSVCYMKAFVAPLAWVTLTSQSVFNSNDYDTLMSAAKRVLLDVPSARTKLPAQIEIQNLRKLMNTLQEVYDAMTEDQRTEVVHWAKEQILQNNFSCTQRKTSNPKSKMMAKCKPGLKWLSSDALSMIGPFLSGLSPSDVDSAPKDALCEFFSSARLKSSLSNATRLNPSVAKRFVQNIQQCFTPKDFPNHVDMLGPLACYYNPPKLTPELSKNLLSQLDSCDDSITSKLKKNLVDSVLSGPSGTQGLGRHITLLKPKQLRDLPKASLKEVIQNLGSSVEWSQSQLRTLAKKQLGDKKCGEVTAEDVMDLRSAAAGLPSCALKSIKAEKILSDPEALSSITKQMKRGQLKAMLQGLGRNVSELLQKLSGPLLRSVSLSNLDEANITHLDEVENKTWSLPQATYLAKKLHNLRKLQFRRLNSLLRGITCKMFAEVNDTNALDMAQAVAEHPVWLSKVQVGCAALRLFKSLEQERTDYFRNITEQELAAIPTLLLIHLPQGKVKDLPDSVCQVFLYKMETANLSSLSLQAPSRQALSQRALLCLTAGKNMSELTSADVLRLGPLLCETKPSELTLMAPDVITSSLQAMASCQYIPGRHVADLMQLVTNTFGSPSNWTADTVELLGPLLLLDDNAVSALPNEPWMKDVLIFLRSRLPDVSEAFKRKLFEVSTNTSASTPTRKRRAAESNSSSNATEPTETQIEEMGQNNVFWAAADLEMISNSTFLAVVEILGSVTGYSSDQLNVLQGKAIEAFGPVAQMSESVVVQLGCIAQGFSNAELKELRLPLDSLDDVAQCGWNHSQVKSVWRGVANYNNLTVELLGAAEMVGLSRFICGLNSSELSQLDKNAFKDAVGSMKGLQCPVDVLQQLKTLAVSAFGSASSWTEAQVSDLDNIIAGMNAREMSSLDPAVFAFFSQSCIPQIPPQVFAALSVAQLEALGPDNAASVTLEQRAALTVEQRAALDTAAAGTVGQETQIEPKESGAPALSVEGIYAFMKPVLVLLIGLLLL